MEETVQNETVQNETAADELDRYIQLYDYQVEIKDVEGLKQLAEKLESYHDPLAEEYREKCLASIKRLQRRNDLVWGWIGIAFIAYVVIYWILDIFNVI